MSANSSGGVQLAGAGSGVNSNGLANDQSIANQLADGLSRVGVGDFVDFVGIKPDLALATSHDRRSKALLGGEVDPVIKTCSACGSYRHRLQRDRFPLKSAREFR